MGKGLQMSTQRMLLMVMDDGTLVSIAGGDSSNGNTN